MQSILSVASTRKTKLLDIADRNLKRYSYFGKQPSTLNINIHTQCLTQQLHSWPCSQRNEHLYIFTKNIYILSPYYRSVLLQALTGADYDERMFFFFTTSVHSLASIYFSNDAIYSEKGQVCQACNKHCTSQTILAGLHPILM